MATVAWTTDQVLRRLLPGEAAPLWSDPFGGVDLIQVPVPSLWAGRPVGAVVGPGRFRAVAVSRDAETTLASDDLVLQDGDVLYVAVRGGDRSAGADLLDGPEEAP